jgi:O-succinylbenzoic acid--CoA ligase
VVHDGRPLSGTEVGLAEDGEVLVRGPMVMRGYRLRPDLTTAAFTADGWLRTGDAGTWLHDGRLQVLDRLTDMVITGGVNVSPSEVEAVLVTHAAVADVAVVAGPDAEWGQRVVACVVPADAASPPTLAELRAFAADRLSAAKLPRQLVVVASVPRTAGGKPRRRLLATFEVGDDG